MNNSMLKKSSNFQQHQFSDDSIDDGLKVNPADFVEFLPWACAQLGVDAIVLITKNLQVDAPAYKDHKGKGKKSKTVSRPYISESDQQDPFTKSTASFEEIDEERAVHILATYKGDYLTHIKIHKTRHLPKDLLYLFGLVIKFYPHLYGISINSGVDQYTIHELSKFLPLSNITEICFDNTFCKEANYDILLDCCRNITMLSLCRCKITDQVLKNIADKLAYEQPASLTLSILNLSSNRLTDKSAMVLAEILRMNRRLNYLNLASNSITDEGAKAILNTLSPFPFTMEEVMKNKNKYLTFSKEKRQLINKLAAHLRTVDADAKQIRKRSMKPIPLSTNKLTQAMICHGLKPLDPIDQLQEAIYQSRAEDLAYDRMGNYSDPASTDTFSDNGWIYSNGNNTLAYLNLAYNNISYVTLNKLIDVLKHQKTLSRKPRGLVNVCLEGNPLPKCDELIQIDYLLDLGLRLSDRRPSAVHGKKRSTLKYV